MMPSSELSEASLLPVVVSSVVVPVVESPPEEPPFEESVAGWLETVLPLSA
jgi:hypothetical protein